MSDNTAIEWTDATWNPVTGCTEVSPGCDHCYAKTFAERWRGTEGHYFERGFDVQLRPDKLDQPLRWKKPRKIFVNSMSDLFHDSVSEDYIAQVFGVMHRARQHTFQVLTKRHGRMRSLLNSREFWAGVSHHAGVYLVDAEPLPNVWLGVSAENRQWADIRIPALIETPAAERFVSAEPLLGSIDMSCWLQPGGVSWVIVGGESGHGARPMHSDWVTSLWEQCRAADVAFLLKQWGEYTSELTIGKPLRGPRPDALVNSITGEVVTDSREVYGPGSWQHVWRVGKKRAGRELLGRTWDQYPEAVHA